MFSAENITAGYGKKKVIKNISFDIENGQIMGIIGGNGCGKTTLLKAICGILPHYGKCMLDSMVLEDLSVKKRSQMCSYIPQRSGISIDIPVLDVVLMGFNSSLGLLERPDEKMKEKALRAINAAGLEGMEDINYLNLSEGQKQLCILARTMVSESSLLLLDEPESALDFKYRYKMLEVIEKRLAENGGSALVTLHDPMLALNFCHKLLLLSEGEAVGIIKPDLDSVDKMEKLLSEIYGEISLQRCTLSSGKSQLVMLREDIR